MFVLLFGYVFGGAIHIPGVPYVDYLMPGIFVQTVSFGAVSTAVGLAEDLHKGLIERFRALPMARSAVLAGRTTADLARNVFVVFLITGVGFAVGLPHRHQRRPLPLRRLARAALLLRAELGLRHRRPVRPERETAQVMAFPILFPLHLRLVGLRPGGLDAGLAAGLRQEPAGHPGGRRGAGRSWSAGPLHDTGRRVAALAWIVGLLVVLVPLAVRKYRKVA